MLQVTALEIYAFLGNVAGNAACVGIENVVFDGVSGPVMVRADDYSLEDVVTHVLRNADRYRVPGSAITLELQASETAATITIHNQGQHIAEDMLNKNFE